MRQDILLSWSARRKCSTKTGSQNGFYEVRRETTSLVSAEAVLQAKLRIGSKRKTLSSRLLSMRESLLKKQFVAVTQYTVKEKPVCPVVRLLYQKLLGRD